MEHKIQKIDIHQIANKSLHKSIASTVGRQLSWLHLCLVICIDFAHSVCSIELESPENHLEQI
jgi:hypothetical protein